MAFRNLLLFLPAILVQIYPLPVSAAPAVPDELVTRKTADICCYTTGDCAYLVDDPNFPYYCCHYDNTHCQDGSPFGSSQGNCITSNRAFPSDYCSS